MQLRKLSEDYIGAGGLLGFILPISVSFGLVMLFHLLVKLGISVPSPLLQPVFDVWIVFCGILIALFIMTKAIFLMFLGMLISFVGTVVIYLMYVVH